MAHHLRARAGDREKGFPKRLSARCFSAWRAGVRELYVYIYEIYVGVVSTLEITRIISLLCLIERFRCREIN